MGWLLIFFYFAQNYIFPHLSKTFSLPWIMCAKAAGQVRKGIGYNWWEKCFCFFFTFSPNVHTLLGHVCQDVLQVGTDCVNLRGDMQETWNDHQNHWFFFPFSWYTWGSRLVVGKLGWKIGSYCVNLTGDMAETWTKKETLFLSNLLQFKLAKSGWRSQKRLETEMVLKILRCML